MELSLFFLFLFHELTILNPKFNKEMKIMEELLLKTLLYLIK